VSQPIPPHVAETVHAITLLHAEHHRKSTLSERIVDRATAFVGRPTFLLIAFALILCWVCFNVVIRGIGGKPPDPPPFEWMDLICTMTALLITVLILTSQRRADKFANLREQMTLEATLLTEQKTRKIIELIEELRRDSPEIVDRVDPEAEQMASKSDPHAVLEVIEESRASVAEGTLGPKA
jgi:uncharacterized membrane protein